MRLITTPDESVPWPPGAADARGLAGERAVVANLAAGLDDRYLAISRLRLPGTRADLDLVVLAAQVVVMEVKTYRGPRQYRCSGSIWSYADAGGHWWPLDVAPGAQAAFGAARVRRRLADAGLLTRVQAAVVWAGDAALTLDAPGLPVLRLPALAGWLSAIGPIPALRRDRIARALLAGLPCAP